MVMCQNIKNDLYRCLLYEPCHIFERNSAACFKENRIALVQELAYVGRRLLGAVIAERSDFLLRHAAFLCAVCYIFRVFADCYQQIRAFCISLADPLMQLM